MFRGRSFTRRHRKENTPYAATNTVIRIEFLYWLLGVVVMTEGRRTVCPKLTLVCDAGHALAFFSELLSGLSHTGSCFVQ